MRSGRSGCFYGCKLPGMRGCWRRALLMKSISHIHGWASASQVDCTGWRKGPSCQQRPSGGPKKKKGHFPALHLWTRTSAAFCRESQGDQAWTCCASDAPWERRARNRSCHHLQQQGQLCFTSTRGCLRSLAAWWRLTWHWPHTPGSLLRCQRQRWCCVVELWWLVQWGQLVRLHLRRDEVVLTANMGSCTRQKHSQSLTHKGSALALSECKQRTNEEPQAALNNGMAPGASSRLLNKLILPSLNINPEQSQHTESNLSSHSLLESVPWCY